MNIQCNRMFGQWALLAMIINNARVHRIFDFQIASLALLSFSAQKIILALLIPITSATNSFRSISADSYSAPKMHLSQYCWTDHVKSSWSLSELDWVQLSDMWIQMKWSTEVSKEKQTAKDKMHDLKFTLQINSDYVMII